jgi:hypothetical protein
MTRSKQLRRIERAIAGLNVSELRWALAECELLQKRSKGHSSRWYQIEKRIRAAFAHLDGEPRNSPPTMLGVTARNCGFQSHWRFRGRRD